MLTEQMKLFVEEYIRLNCKNAGKAAVNAGYSAKTARSQANRLLTNVDIQNFLKERKEALRLELQENLIFQCQQALEIEVKVMTDPKASDRDRLTAARDILDRAGFKATENIKLSGEISNVNPFAELTKEQLEKLANIGDDES